MNKKTKNLVIIGVSVAILLLAIVVIYLSTGEEDTQKTNLPDISEEDYNLLQASNDDFSALDEAVESLE